MKKILFILIILIMPVCLLFTGCDSNIIENNNYDRFYLVYYKDTIIYVDKETKVMYLVICQNSGTGITVMVDENGNPLLWQGEL